VVVEYVAALAPLIGVPTPVVVFNSYHWYVTPVPLAAAFKLAVEPLHTEVLAGCVVIATAELKEITALPATVPAPLASL
jgi:hypothetical protein